MKTIDDIFKLYIDKKDEREVLHNPFIQDGYVYATDGYILIRVKANDIKSDNYEEHKFPNCSNLFSNLTNESHVTIKDLEKKISKIEMIDETIRVGEDIKCKECDGSGVVEWEYERWIKHFDCPECDGDGYSQMQELKPTGQKIKDPDGVIYIINRYFRVKYIDVLIETMKYFETETVQIKYSDKSLSRMLFIINENVMVLMMPTTKKPSIHI